MNHFSISSSFCKNSIFQFSFAEIVYFSVFILTKSLKMSRQPLIIRTHLIKKAVPNDSELFDPVQQTEIPILQAINAYFIVNMTIESSKIFWSFQHFREECPSYSNLSIGFMALNILWALFSYFGFKSIRIKNSRHIRIFSCLTILNLILRASMYAICEAVMTRKTPSQAVITQQQINNRICFALYPQTVYKITGIFEVLILILILLLLPGLITYTKQFQQRQAERMIPLKESKTY